MKKLILLLFLIPCTFYSQWSWVNPTPQGNYLDQLIYTNDHKIIASGEYGTILVSTNEGINWNVMFRTEGTGDNFTSCYKLNDNSIFYGTFHGNLYKTTNGGNTLTKLYEFHINNISNLYFVNDTIGYCILNGYNVYKTSNNGLNWNNIFSITGGYSLSDITFLNANTGFIVGGEIFEGSKLYKTTNGGLNWIENLNLPTSTQIDKIVFTNYNTGYASTYNAVLKTTNQGINWNLYQTPNTSYGFMSSLSFVDSLTGYLGNTADRYLYKTTNGGINWSEIIIPYYAFNTLGVQTVIASSPQTIYVLTARHIILKSTNSGANFIPLTNGFYEPLKTMFFTDANTGYLGGWSNIIRKTVNRGLNWNDIVLPYSTYINSIFFTDNNTGYGVGGGGTGYVFKTTNSGANWIKTDSMGTGANSVVYFINNQTGFILGYSGEIWRTSNSGLNWTVYNSGVQYRLFTITFTDSNTGYAAGGEVTPKILKTTNSGINWFDLYSAPNTSFWTLKFINSMTGFVSGTGIRKTTNAGLNWNQLFTSASIPNIHDFNFIDNNTGLAIGDYGRMFKTTNSGYYWQEVESPTYNFTNQIYFSDANTGIIIGDQGLILRTTNFGGFQNFYTISGQIRFQDNNQPVSQGYVKALVLNKNSGQVITVDSARIQSNGSYNLIHIPQDSIYIMAYADDQLSQIFIPTYYDSTIHWQNAHIIFPSGNMTNLDVHVFRSSSSPGTLHIGGGVFTNQTSLVGVPNSILYARLGNQYKGYSICGSTGTYQIDSLSQGSYTIICDRLGYDGGSKNVSLISVNQDTVNFYLFSIIGIQKKLTVFPSKFTLYQNYPNPFNPVTTIKFDLPKSSVVQLKIYDLLGREVIKLVDGKLNPGTYNIEWNASGFASGVYFYKLESNDFVQTKKLVLIK